MAISKGKSSISFKDLDSIPEAMLVSHYLGVTEIPCFIHSPLRKDSRPSFGLYSNDGKRIFWKDLATREGGGIYDLLSLMWHCDIKEVLIRVQKELLSNEKSAKINNYSPCNINNNLSKSNSDLQCKVREWRPYDIEYWSSFGISLEWLKYAEVYPISHKIVISNGKKYIFSADKLAYAYVERKEGKVTLKIYQPLCKDKNHKWSNKHDRSVISLWTKIPKSGDKVVICSSLKDSLCLWANTGIPAIAVQGEGFKISDTAISELKRRFNKVYILFDNDEAGLIDGKKLSEETGFINVVLPKFEGGKDISDLYKIKGKEAFLNIIKPLFINNETKTMTQNIKIDEDIDPFALPF